MLRAEGQLRWPVAREPAVNMTKHRAGCHALVIKYLFSFAAPK